MKKNKLFLISVLTLAIIFTLSISSLGTLAQEATANPTVTLVTSGGQASFTFNRADGNLFDEFEGVMPGDTPTQTVTVESASGNSGNFRIYMYAVEVADAEKSTTGFLNAMSLKVLDGTTELNVLNANTTNTYGVLLGTFYPGSKKNLTVSLKLPIEMGDSFQGANSTVKWYFYAEQVFDVIILDNSPVPMPSPSPAPSPAPSEIPDDDTPTGDLPVVDIPDSDSATGNMPIAIDDAPQTGDDSNPLIWVLLMVGSGSALTCLLIFGRKGKSK